MFTVKIDKKWLEKQMDEIREQVPVRIKNHLEHMAQGVILDCVKQALKEELAKSEYRERLQKIAKEMLIDQNSEQMIRHFLRGRY